MFKLFSKKDSLIDELQSAFDSEKEELDNWQAEHLETHRQRQRLLNELGPLDTMVRARIHSKGADRLRAALGDVLKSRNERLQTELAKIVTKDQETAGSLGVPEAQVASPVRGELEKALELVRGQIKKLPTMDSSDLRTAAQQYLQD